MIVDDNPANLKLLEDMLLHQSHEVRSFPLGRLALASALNEPPSLILLDINMPEMNGYQVCERIKSTRQLADIPVIFLSALNDTEDKVKGFHSGGVDYISKPFQFEEVLARVETHLKLHELQRELTLQNERLEEAVLKRTGELADANRLLSILDRSKDEFLGLISHEFRTPLSGLLGTGEIILDRMPATEENQQLRGLFERSRKRILSILDDAMLLTEIDIIGERHRVAPVSLEGALTLAIENAAEFAQSRGVALDTAPAGPDLVLADLDLLVRALNALIETAVKFSRPGQTVRLSSGVSADSPGIVIESTGRSIPPPLLPKFFAIFSINEPITPGGDLGLGPPMAHRILSLFGGSVSVANLDPSGIRLTVALRTASV
jgi:two-component system sensor histidine kinase/response regulator